MQSKGNLDFILPEEGSTLWILGAVVPTRSLHLGWAESFVNFILNPQQVAQIVEASHQASPLAETWPGLPEMASANYLKKVPLARIKVDEGLEPMGLSSGELEKWLETLK
jgi:spermidine/putrescine-binding protein